MRGTCNVLDCAPMSEADETALTQTKRSLDFWLDPRR